jgi:hypothetical protein
VVEAARHRKTVQELEHSGTTLAEQVLRETLR